MMKKRYTTPLMDVVCEQVKEFFTTSDLVTDGSWDNSDLENDYN